MNSEFSTENRSHFWRELVETLLLALLFFLLIRFTIQNFNIDGTSMEPSLHNSELVLVDKLAYLFHQPERGDIIVFRAPPDPSEDYVKRVIGLPGDMITINGTTVSVNGVTLHESYVAPEDQGVPMGAHEIHSLLVPPDMYFVLGDNRAVSSDSRIWGFLPRQNIIGHASFVYWPVGRDNSGIIPSAAPVFAAIHQNALSGGPLSLITNHINALWLLLIPLLFLLFLRWRSLHRLFLQPAPKKLEPDSRHEPEPEPL